MRLRNVSGSKEIIAENEYVVHNPADYIGKWNEVFHNDRPVHIEIGMGKGQFLMQLAAMNPEINYIGIEKYDSVLVRALEKRENQELTNLYFIRFDAQELLQIFAADDIAKIYLNFSDPWPKDRHAKRRLTSQEFLYKYDMILQKNGTIEFKTDNKHLFDFSLAQVNESKWNIDACTYDLHNDRKMSEGNVMTEYEQKFSSMGNPIYKMIISRD